MTVKKIDVTSGPSIIKRYFTVYDNDGKEIGSISDRFMCQVGGLCSSGFIVRRYGHSMEIYPTAFDAVNEGLGLYLPTFEVDEILSQLFMEGFKL